MKQNKKLARIVSALLVPVLILTLCTPAFAAKKSVEIGSLGELKAFAKRCASDTYSKGLTVVLTKDINASGAEVSVPIFCGSFDGQNHRIYGLQLTGNASDLGLFSIVESGAEIKNLSVEGQVTPGGSQNCVGGIAGVNRGSIRNCSFYGLVMADEMVGGITGKNESGASVIDCTALGAVRGKQSTGGVAGQNAGSLLRCTNQAAVNTTVHEADLSIANLENVESTIYSLLKKEKSSGENPVTNDTGGIVGYSTGVVQSCVNSGMVGYPHVGYNVGGIAGRQNGYLANCENQGTVQGRKDVGGVVGQMAPDITMQFSSDGLDELQGELNKLQSLIDRTLQDAESASNTVSGRVARISDYADDARESAYSLTGQLSDFTDSNLSEVNRIALLAERYIAKAAPILDDLAVAADSVTRTIPEIRGLVDILLGMEDYNAQALKYFQAFCSEIKAFCDDLNTALDALDRIYERLEKGPARPDTSQLRKDIAALREAAGQLEATVGRAQEEIGISGTITEGTRQQLKEDLQTVLDDTASVIRSAVKLVTETDFGVLRDQNLETLRQIAADWKTAMNAFSSAIKHFGNAMEDLEKMVDVLQKINKQSADALRQLDLVLQSAQQASASLTNAFYRSACWARDLGHEDPASFKGLGSEFNADSDALNTSLSGISSELSALNGEIADANSSLLSEVRAVNRQFMKVMNLFLNLLNDTKNVDYTDVYEDVSEKNLKSTAKGKVLECKNYGTVEGDRNTGGVAGSMAIEYDLDPEDDLTTSGERSVRFTYQTRAILMNCSNYGEVQAKKSCAGGVCGRMDLGTITGCGGYGTVTSETGDYVGGVCGLSLSSIRKSYAKCTVSGRSYIGGIVGSGNQVTNCAAMTRIAQYTQLGGAIAGEITGSYSKNRFVSDELAGVDRVSYAGKAEKISYRKLCRIKEIPDEFRTMTLTFLVDGKTVKKLNFDYGDSFEENVFPEAAAKEDCYVRWEPETLSDLHFDTVVTAVYEPYVTTIASSQERETGHPIFLVQGQFRDEDALRVSSMPDAGGVHGSVLESWKVEIPSDGAETHNIRWLIPDGAEKSVTVYADTGSGMKKIKSEQNGSYQSFTLTGGDAVIAFTESAGSRARTFAAAGGGAALLLAAGAALMQKRRRGKGTEKDAEATKEADPEEAEENENE